MSRSGSKRSIAPIRPEQPVRDEVALLHVRGEPAPEPPRDVLDERRVGEDQPVAERPVARPLELAPERLGVDRAGHGGEHSDRYRKARTACSPIQSARSAAAADHPAPPPASAAATATPAKPDRDQDEEHSERRSSRRATKVSLGGVYNGRAEGRSSTGRAPVSKTGGCRFESCRPCFGDALGSASGVSASLAHDERVEVDVVDPPSSRRVCRGEAELHVRREERQHPTHIPISDDGAPSSDPSGCTRRPRCPASSTREPVGHPRRRRRPPGH